jgi:hypothetical protein
MAHVQGPDFPTGGVIVEPRASLLEAYETGRGGVRTRARWSKEDTGRGTWRIVVTEIPYQVKKADLVEQIAGLIESKRAPLLGDVIDESAEDIRLVLEPRARTVEPELLMESLFKLSDLEARFGVNMNVLDAKGAPRVMGLKEALRAFLDHRREVLVRRARFRLGKIEQRLHVLAGLLIVFLNLDEVIRIVRYEDEPKARLMTAFEIDDVQADAILNTRLRQLAKLEEMELRREHADLSEERDGIQAMLASDKQQWKLIAAGLKDIRKALGPDTDVGRRRSSFAEAPQIEAAAAVEALVAREPITVILSERGWIRAARGRIDDPSPSGRRPLLHAGGRQAAVGPRAGRAAAPAARPRRPRGGAGAVRLPAGRQAGAGVKGRLRFRAARGRGGGDAPGRQAGAERRGPKQGSWGRRVLPGRRRRPTGGVGRQRQGADLPARRVARDAARQGRQAAELPRRGPARRPGVLSRGGRRLDRRRRPHASLAGLAHLARPPLRRRAFGPKRIPGLEAIQARIATLRLAWHGCVFGER